MNKDATSLDKARFWVRPYEFEGDGTTGAALAAAACIEVGGKTRTFWIKTLENRLFFREIGRDDGWNFGALEKLSEAEQSDLPTALARVLARESYGRVVLLEGENRPCFGLASPNGQVQCLVPDHQLSTVSRWKMSTTGKELGYESQETPLIDWQPGSLYINKTSQLFHEFRRDLKSLPAPLIEVKWVRGSHQEVENILKSFLVYHWRVLTDFPDNVIHMEWRHSTAWQMQNSAVFLSVHFDFRPHFPYGISQLYTPRMQQLLEAINRRFLVVGQGEHQGKCYRYTAKGRVSEPTHHEILEAHLYLRDWINERLPPKQARKWLDFS